MKKFLYSLIPLAFSLLIIGNFASAADDYGLGDTAGQIDAFKEQAASLNSGQARDFLQSRAGSIISLVLSFVGIIFFILIIYAGMMWMLAQGNTEKVSKAKDLIINAVIGLVIVFSAYAITSFIGNQIAN